MNIEIVFAILSLLLIAAFVMRWLRFRQADPALMLRALGVALDQIEKLIDRLPLIKRPAFQVRYFSLRIEQKFLDEAFYVFKLERQVVSDLTKACRLANELRRDVLLLLPREVED